MRSAIFGIYLSQVSFMLPTNPRFLYFLPPGDSIGSIYGSKNHELERKNINTRQRKTNYIVSMDGLEIGKLLEQDNKKSDTPTYF